MACRLLFTAEILGFCSGKGREGAEPLEGSAHLKLLELLQESQVTHTWKERAPRWLLSEPRDTQGALP